MEQKITTERAQELAQLHADGVSMRTLAKLYGISPALVHRHIHRANDTTPEPSGNTDSTGAVEGDVRPLRRHAETEFPAFVPGYEPDVADAPDVLDVGVVAPPPLPPDRAPGQPKQSNTHPLDWAEHKLRCARQDIARIRSAPDGYVRDRDTKLAQAEQDAALYAEFIDTWADAYAGLTFGRPSCRVKVGEQALRDGPAPALWDNPYDQSPRGFDVVGS